MPNKIIKFSEIPEGLYAIDMETNNERLDEVKIKNCMVTSIQHDDSFYPPRRITRAKKAIDLYHLLGAQSVRALKALITQNHIKDNPVVI